MSFKIAYGAGHNDKTTRGIPESMHKPRMNEWRLNDRVARYFAEAAAMYENVELLRVDDPLGQKPVSLYGRCNEANTWGADFFLSIHHNGGIKGGKGGGLCAFCYKEGTKAAEYRDEIYATCLEDGGIKGNRSQPKQAYGFVVLAATKMPAVLMEYGFMDSTTDVPIILTDAFAKAQAYATMRAIAKVANLKLKPENDPANQKIYRVQVGAFNEKENALAQLEQLKEAGFEGFIVEHILEQAEEEQIEEETKEPAAEETATETEEEGKSNDG